MIQLSSEARNLNWLVSNFVGGVPAVIPEVTGTAHITGRHEFFIDPADPLREGFLV